MTLSQSAFVRGFIDDPGPRPAERRIGASQSAFVRGFIDDVPSLDGTTRRGMVSIRVRARLHR